MQRYSFRLIIALLTFTIGVIAAALWYLNRSMTSRSTEGSIAEAVSPHISTSNPLDGELSVFEGTVLAIAPPVPASGGSAFYRLAKYRVERACQGRYEESEIVVDHLSLTTKELEGIKVGDRVCVTVRPSEKIFARYNVEGIRAESEEVKIFYVGGEVQPPGSRCECDDR